MPCRESRFASALCVLVIFIWQANNVGVVGCIGFDTQAKITDEPDVKTQNGLAIAKTLGALCRCALNAHRQPFVVAARSTKKRASLHPAVVYMDEARPQDSSIDDRTTTESW